MEDQKVPIMIPKTQFFIPRKLRRRMNYFWAYKEPKNPAIEMKVRKMKRNLLDRASLSAEAVYSSWKKLVDDKDELKLESLEAISNQIQAGIFTPKKLRNSIYSRMLEEAADAQLVAAAEAAAAEAAAAAQFAEAKLGNLSLEG